MPTSQPPPLSPPHPGAPTAVGHRKTTGRRRLLYGLFACGSLLALSPTLRASGSADPAQRGFDVTYGGRRIVGALDPADLLPGDASGGWRVTVDGQPLHLMRRADGSWMSMIDHYGSYPTPLAAARAAVDELRLATGLGAPGHGASPSGHKGTEGGHGSGVHA